MLNKINQIKIFHSLIWVVMVAAIFCILYAGITETYNVFLWISLGLMALEGVTLMINKGSCPLTIVAKTTKKDYKDGDDIFLPKWLAIHNKAVFGSLLVLGLLILLYRLFSS
jgi:hypothetical protein